jgi:hypothetical protein
MKIRLYSEPNSRIGKAESWYAHYIGGEGFLLSEATARRHVLDRFAHDYLPTDGILRNDLFKMTASSTNLRHRLHGPPVPF